MIADSLSTPQQILNTKTGATGLFYRQCLSPYYREEVQGIQRVQVWTDIPGAGGDFKGWDYWSLEDCQLLEAAAIPTGATVKLMLRKQVVYGVVLNTNHTDVCVLLDDGRAGWVSLKYVQAIYATEEVAS